MNITADNCTPDERRQPPEILNPTAFRKGNYMSAVKEPQRVPGARQTANNRTLRTGKWVESLQTSDVNQLWAELHRVVSYHPLVRASRTAGLLVEEDSRSGYKDLTQELFVVLLSKERFQHYLNTEMTNAEIELEIGQIELTNLLTSELRKRYPESYRLARRVSTLVQTSRNFRRFDVSSTDQPHPHRRLAERVYGLSFWSDGKAIRTSAELEERMSQVPMRFRDTRKVGCTGDSQVVINNADLENLIVQVLDTIDSLVDIRTLRSLVMSRLPVMDIYLVPISGGSEDDENSMPFEPQDGKLNPEQSLLSREAIHAAGDSSVDIFLQTLSAAVRGKAKQYNRILSVLWHCYLSAEGGTQLEIAASLGVSDSLVSEYRRRIEIQLQELSFTELEQARQFEQSLKRRVRELIENNETVVNC